MEAKLTIISFVLLFLNISTLATVRIPLPEKSYPTSCKDLSKDERKIDIIQIKVDKEKKPFYVKCNHAIDGGGWTVVLNRYDRVRSFNCKWKDCVQGFGNINQEFFIGLEKLHEITSSTLHELIFVMEGFNGTKRFARYNAFAIDDATNSYMISVLGDYTGDAGDMFAHHAGNKFSTEDRDSSGSCVMESKAPGWFNSCSGSNIFGEYDDEVEDNFGFSSYAKSSAMYWYIFQGPLTRLTMLIRPIAS